MYSSDFSLYTFSQTSKQVLWIFLKLGFTPCKAEQSLRGTELKEKQAKKDFAIRIRIKPFNCVNGKQPNILKTFLKYLEFYILLGEDDSALKVAPKISSTGQLVINRLLINKWKCNIENDKISTSFWGGAK